LLRFVDARRVLVIAHALLMPMMIGHACLSLLRTMLRVLRRRPVAAFRPMPLLCIRGPLAMRRRPMLVAARRHRMNGRMSAVTGHLGAQVLAPVEDFGAAIAARVEMAMTLAVRADHPKIRAAANEHHVAIDDARDIDVARRGNVDGLRRGRRRTYDDGGRRRRLHRDDGGTRPRGRGGDLLLAGDTAG
jgi:hypothetical protein